MSNLKLESVLKALPEALLIFTRKILSRRLKATEISRFQDKKIRELVKYSYNTIPFYHDLFKERGLKPDNVKGIEDLKKLPVLEKEKLRSVDLEKMTPVGTDINKFYLVKTSGTTGKPLRVYRDRQAKITGYLQEYLWRLSCGDKITNKQTCLDSRWTPFNHPLEKIGVFRTQFIAASTPIEKQIQQISRFNPDTVSSIPSFLVPLAKAIKYQDIRVIDPYLIFTGGEILDANTRRLITKTFNAEVFDGYGANEVGGIGKECTEHSGYHVLGNSIFVEITKDGEVVADGEEGNVTVTDLVNHATPLIRYNLKDTGIMSRDECSCGNPFPLIKLAGGRQIDFLQLPSGRRVSAVPFYSDLVQMDGIRQFQLIQENINHF
jgi:phenylacetate-CoA ligase